MNEINPSIVSAAKETEKYIATFSTVLKRWPEVNNQILNLYWSGELFRASFYDTFFTFKRGSDVYALNYCSREDVNHLWLARRALKQGEDYASFLQEVTAVCKRAERPTSKIQNGNSFNYGREEVFDFGFRWDQKVFLEHFSPQNPEHYNTRIYYQDKDTLIDVDNRNIGAYDLVRGRYLPTLTPLDSFVTILLDTPSTPGNLRSINGFTFATGEMDCFLNSPPPTALRNSDRGSYNTAQSLLANVKADSSTLAYRYAQRVLGAINCPQLHASVLDSYWNYGKKTPYKKQDALFFPKDGKIYALKFSRDDIHASLEVDLGVREIPKGSNFENAQFELQPFGKGEEYGVFKKADRFDQVYSMRTIPNARDNSECLTYKERLDFITLASQKPTSRTYEEIVRKYAEFLARQKDPKAKMEYSSDELNLKAVQFMEELSSALELLPEFKKRIIIYNDNIGSEDVDPGESFALIETADYFFSLNTRELPHRKMVVTRKKKKPDFDYQLFLKQLQSKTEKRKVQGFVVWESSSNWEKTASVKLYSTSDNTKKGTRFIQYKDEYIYHPALKFFAPESLDSSVACDEPLMTIPAVEEFIEYLRALSGNSKKLSVQRVPFARLFT